MRVFVLLLSIALLTQAKSKSSKAGESKTKEQVVYDLRRWTNTGIVNCSSTASHYSCPDDKTRLIPRSQLCDGRADCMDSSDEWNCTECLTPFSSLLGNGFLKCITSSDMRWEQQEKKKTHGAGFGCASGFDFRCPNSQLCLPLRSVCDGIPDCADEKSADERNCTVCKKGAKMCAPLKSCISNRRVCDGRKDCPDGSDEKNCTCETCGVPDRALCATGGQCIRRSHVCDGIINCEDGSDEKGCPNSCAGRRNVTQVLSEGCGQWHNFNYWMSEVCSGEANGQCKQCRNKCDSRLAFSCADGSCIPKRLVCDGYDDCDNGEDEKDCLKACLKYPFFMRLNRRKAKCVPRASRCDGVIDFFDGTDEKNCASCPHGSHRCDGGCRPASDRCDGTKHCDDGSDERNCSCEECTSNRTDTYYCESTGTCMRKLWVCTSSFYGPTHSLCPQPTARDELFCAMWSRR